METKTYMTASTSVAFTHARTRALVIVPTFGDQGDVRPAASTGQSRAWSPPV